MLILDTDHMSQLGRESSRRQALELRLSTVTEPIVTTVATAEELLRGRLAQISRAKDRAAVIVTYARLKTAIEAFSEWEILPFDAAAAIVYDRFLEMRLGVGTMDLRIAGIVIANNATLLSRNLRDFQRVPDIKVED